MPYTVDYSFSVFLDRITLTGKHEDTARARGEHLVELLKDSFTILDTIATGSIVHGTALVGHADLDIVTVLHYSKHIKGKSPKAVLEAVRNALSGSSKIVKKNGQAVTLYYTKWPNVDIVPASRVTNDDGSVSHYNIPDMVRGRWLETRPRNHNKKMAATTHGRRTLIRMIKTWNRAHSEFMQSFHISALVLSLPDVTGGWPYEIRYFFEKAVEKIEEPLYYEGAAADSYLDAADRRAVKERLVLAHSRAREAEIASAQDKTEEAIRLYRLIFGTDFPAYG